MTPLEEALATRTIGHSFFSMSTPQHIITRLASYIYHHDNTDVPVAAVQLLTRLASVSISVPLCFQFIITGCSNVNVFMPWSRGTCIERQLCQSPFS